MSESTEAVTNTGDVEKLPGHVDVKLNGDSDQTLKVTSNENDTEKDKLAPISSTDSEPTPTATDAEPVSNITESKLASDSAPAPAKAGEATVNTDSSLKDDANSVTEAKESEAEAVNISQNSTKTESPVSEKSDPSEVKSSESPSLEKSECKDDYSKSPSKVESPATKKAESPAEEKKTPSPSRKRKLSPEKADEESEDDSEDEKGTIKLDSALKLSSLTNARVAQVVLSAGNDKLSETCVQLQNIREAKEQLKKKIFNVENERED